ncbi:MAG TPA: DNA primase [Candidatus Dormibacteraeota bacterium]|nr:DNA primase [Candidatus Dormibacteraeota bacterium]
MAPPGSDDARDQVRSKLDLVDVVQGYLRLTKKGREWVGLCPFHPEKTPSFYVNQGKQQWICHGCGLGGDLFGFIEKIEKVDFRGALELLADKAGVVIERDPGAMARRDRQKRLLEINRLAALYFEYVLHSTPAGEPGLRLLREREVSIETAKRFQLGFAPAGGDGLARYLKEKGRSIPDAGDAGLLRRGGTQDFFFNRLVIPLRDERGQTLAFTARALDAETQPKYLNSPETEIYKKGKVIFGLDLARDEISKQNQVVVVEGQFDVVSCHQAGVSNVVATSGTAMTEDQVRILKRFCDRVILAFDQDAAGRKATNAAIEHTVVVGIRASVLVLPGAKDPDDFIRSAGELRVERWNQAVAHAQTEWEYSMRQAVAGLNLGEPRELGEAVGRVNAVLAKIPDAPTREAYRERAGEWTGIEPHRFIEPSVSGRRSTQSRPTPTKVDRFRGSAQFLLQILVTRPEVAARVRTQLEPDDLPEPQRGTYLKIVDLLASAGEGALEANMEAFDAAEQDLIRRAWSVGPPGGDDDLVLDDVILKLKKESLSRRGAAMISSLSEAERRGDTETALKLQAQLGAMARTRQALNT